MVQESIGGRFRLGVSLGRGGMGEVRQAEDLHAPVDSPARLVAFKTILKNRAGSSVDAMGFPSLVRRFRREAAMMRRLDHRNLPRIIEGGIDEAGGGHPYLVMELLDGCTLTDLVLDVEPLPIDWVTEIGAQIAAGLAEAHAEGVIHRDLKPGNVMLTRQGTVKVLDFGLGRFLDDTANDPISTSRFPQGTYHYMAPEQFRVGEVTAAVDLYALGCVLYEMLSGDPPFYIEASDDIVQLANHHMGTIPAPIDAVRPDIPPELSRLLGRLLAKRPEDRPAEASDVRDLLNALAAERGPLTPLARWDDMAPIHAGHPAPVQASKPDRVPAKGPAGEQVSAGMDVFGIHRQLIADYRAFTEGGTVIRDEAIADYVQQDLDSKAQWPDPWLALNASFAAAGSVEELVARGVLHSECARIFQTSESTPAGG
ncbi:serine/threonine-protein kinase, partial [Streptomyces sp. NPDC001985]|uniref:serine/threonine-protein kinase n=1 Tax=Streptomyces sp. NPDC001985 TaxID=3154406 RepID=UPI0033271FFA